MQIKIQRWLSILLIVVGLVMGGCSTQEPTPLKSSNPKAAETASAPAAELPSSQQSKLPRLEGKATVVLKVKGSPLTIEVDGTNAPITAGNFVDLVQRGVYKGLVFHRVVRTRNPLLFRGVTLKGKIRTFR
jgi:peptidyl-prolyl cis-trans isomerase B (cyclophilin B)